MVRHGAVVRAAALHSDVLSKCVNASEPLPLATGRYLRMMN